MTYVCCLSGSQRWRFSIQQPIARLGAYTAAPPRWRRPFGTVKATESPSDPKRGLQATHTERPTGGHSDDAIPELVTLAHPDYHKIAAFWDEEKNGDLQPADVRHKSTKPVHLRCEGCPTCGQTHEWTAQPNDLTRRGGNVICPFCHGSGAKGRICLCRTIASDDTAMAEWAADNELQPDSVARKSNKVVKWKCLRGVGHADYEARPQNRFFKGEGCPLCAARYGPVKVVRPDLVAEWHEENERSPEKVTCGSDYRAWWRCKYCKHEWQSAVISRANRGTGCPRCARRRPAGPS